MKVEREHCKALVAVTAWRSRQCENFAWSDGYCKMHHPATVAARREQSRIRYEEKQKQGPYYQLSKMAERNRELKRKIRQIAAWYEQNRFRLFDVNTEELEALLKEEKT